MSLLAAVLPAPFCQAEEQSVQSDRSIQLSIVETGAVGDAKTLNTQAIQKAIDRLAAKSGGTVVVPSGRFLTGAVFLKPRVNLHLEKNAVLQGSTHIEDYPSMPTRIEGHTQVWRPALVNADKCDHLRITGEGMIKGGGKPFWDAFWMRIKADKTTKNLDVDRPRNLFIRDSNDVLLSGISLRESGFWNIHLYRCQRVTVEKMDIRTPLHSPSTDGIDVDSCQYVTIRGCYISVDDDDIAMKGTKGPFADQDKDSPAVEHIRISDCTFGLGQGVVTLGSEACHVRDVVVENCKVVGAETNHNILVRLKLRPDTPQHYEDIHFRNIHINHKGTLCSIEPWTQYFDPKGQPPPSQLVEDISISNITGSTTGFGRIDGTANSVLRNITLENIDIKVKSPGGVIRNLRDHKVNNVKINGLPYLPGADAGAANLPRRAEILNAMVLANDHFMAKWPDPGMEIAGRKTRPSNIWTRAVYYEGLMALCQVCQDNRYYRYAVRWGEAHRWGLRNGSKTRNADDQCCGQTYIDLYRIEKKPERVREIKDSIDRMTADGKADDWSWIDALQMAMPVFAKLGVEYGEGKYFEKMYQLYDVAKTRHGGSGLYNPADHLWWRDKDFVAPYKEPNGKNCYWSRGNGWVLAALVRVLEILPPGTPHRDEYLRTFQDMAEALLPLQREDGFWNVSLQDPGHFGGRELTGTALFTYGMAWGINHGHLSRERFGPVVAKAWNAMVRDSLHKDGMLGYVQGTGKEPADGQPVTYDEIPDFEDFGVGCFLLAGSEVFKLK
jgi:rhamnogalacturonyl hydrolase YesR